MSEEIVASIGDVLAENARLRKEVVQATERARITSEAYHQQQDAQREHEAREQAATERALAAEAELARERDGATMAGVMHAMILDLNAAERSRSLCQKMLADETALSKELVAIAVAHSANHQAALGAGRRLLAAWRTERRRRIMLADALQGLLDEPYGCPLCDAGRVLNPAKGHWPECPYEIARVVLAELREA